MNLPFTIYDSRLAAGRRECGYLMAEALVYIGLVFVLLGVAYAALYSFIDNSVVLCRNSEDVSRALHAGERWRADVRAATAGIRIETNASAHILYCTTPRGEVAYTAREGAVFRRIGNGPWVPLLQRVQGSAMLADVRPNVTGWRWELELSPQTKGITKAGRMRPLFTFLAVPHRNEP